MPGNTSYILGLVIGRWSATNTYTSAAPRHQKPLDCYRERTRKTYVVTDREERKYRCEAYGGCPDCGPMAV